MADQNEWNRNNPKPGTPTTPGNPPATPPASDQTGKDAAETKRRSDAGLPAETNAERAERNRRES